MASSLLACSLNSFAYTPDNGYKAPSGYTVIDSALGVTLFANSSKDVFVQVTDLNQNYFEHRYEKNAGNSFNCKPIEKWLKPGDFSVVNGAYFNHKVNPTSVSFPFYPGGNYWGDNNNTRTLCVNNTRASVYNTGGSDGKNMVSCSFSLTVLHPDNTIKPTWRLGRTYFGIPNIGNNYVIFIIAKEKKHDEMVSISRAWGISYNI